MRYKILRRVKRIKEYSGSLRRNEEVLIHEMHNVNPVTYFLGPQTIYKFFDAKKFLLQTEQLEKLQNLLGKFRMSVPQ